MTTRVRGRTSIELKMRQNQIEEEKKVIEATIQKQRSIEQKAVESGDGSVALASRQAIAAQQEQLERLAIDENAITKRLQEYVRNKSDAEKLKVEVQQLHNQTAAEHVKKILESQKIIVQNVRAIEEINERLGDLATQYLRLSGEGLYVPTIGVPWIYREFCRVTTMLGPGSRQLLQPVEPLVWSHLLLAHETGEKEQ